MLRWNDVERTLDVGVRDLMRAREGRFAPAGVRLAMSGGGRMRAGREVHAQVEEERGETGWSSERVVRISLVVRGWTCTVHGRVDGVEEADGHTIIEEVKSTGMTSSAMEAAAGFPEWEAQLGLYVWMATELRWANPVGQLRVVSLVDGSQRICTLAADPAVGTRVLGYFGEAVFERERWLAWQGKRRNVGVASAHGSWRIGQEGIVAASRSAVEEGRHLLLTAPTGVGKTAAVMAGVLTAAAKRGLGVYWATARGTQQWVAEKTARAMIAAGTPLRAVTLRSRENACCNKQGLDLVVDCRPEACRFAAGHAVNMQANAVVHQLQPGFSGAAEVDAAAGGFTVCPYELAVDLAAGADLVIGDYNQAFDPARALRRVFEERDWIVVVDEAHQLPDRAMGYGSPTLAVGLCVRVLAIEGPGWEAMRELAADIQLHIEEASWQAVERPTADGDLVVELAKEDWASLRDRVDELAADHARLRERCSPDDHSAWEELAFAVAHFSDALSRSGEETVTLWNAAGLRLLCRDPAPLLGPVFGDFVASISMSATLRPTWFYRERCGMDAERVTELVVPSPFPPENRRVVVVNGLTTAWKDRDRQRSRIRAVLEGILAGSDGVPPSGNVAFYFASYEQRDDLCDGLETVGRRVLATARPRGDASDEAVRLHVVAELHARRDVLLTTVLGGAYAEGVDLPNDALSTVVVVGPALPPPGVDRKLLQDWYEQRWDAGFDLAYLHPGMTRVVQAAGRVVRSATDKGTVWLVCERFLRHEFARYFPEEWEITRRSAQSGIP